MQHKDKQKNVHLWFQQTRFFLKIISMNNDGGKREQNPKFVARFWPPLPHPPTMSTKILLTFSFFGA
jgi:hypothetical protein